MPLIGALVFASGMMNVPPWLGALSVRCSTPESPTPPEQAMYPPPPALMRIVPGGCAQSLKSYAMIGLLMVIGETTVSNALLLVADPLGPVATTLNFAPLSASVVAGVV